MGCVVGGDVEELEALAQESERALSGDAMARSVEASEPLGSDVNQLSGPLALIPDRRG